MSDLPIGRNLSWKVLQTDMIADCRVFTVHRSLSKNEGRLSGKEFNFFFIKSPNWVNVIPITPDGKVIFIKQFRHGTSTVILEIPGGMIDPGEDHAEAAQRELLEETGYATDEMVYLGFSHPNPAIQDNLCYSYLARNVKKLHEPQFDTTEDIEVVEVPFADVPRLIREGIVSHALVITAFHLLGLSGEYIQ